MNREGLLPKPGVVRQVPREHSAGSRRHIRLSTLCAACRLGCLPPTGAACGSDGSSSGEIDSPRLSPLTDSLGAVAGSSSVSLLMISKLFVLYPQEWLLTQTAELRQLFLGGSACAWLETGIAQAVAGYLKSGEDAAHQLDDGLPRQLTVMLTAAAASGRQRSHIRCVRN